MGPSAEVCGPGGGDECDAFSGQKTKKFKGSKTTKQPKTKRVVEERVFKDEMSN